MFRQAAVLGATGMIGTHAVLACLHERIPVRAVVRPDSDRSNLAGHDLDYATGDLDDGDSLRTALAGCDLVIHAAAPYPRRYFGKQTFLSLARTRTRNLLDAFKTNAAGSQSRLVYVSSATTIGRASCSREKHHAMPALAREDDRASIHPRSSPYYEVKHMMEQMAAEAAAQGLSVSIVNPTFCIDEYDSHRTTAQLLVSLAKGRIPAYVPGWLNAVATRDVGVGILLAAQRGRSGERYILGGENLSSRDLIARCARAAGIAPPRRALPMPIAEAVSFSTEACARLTGCRPLFPMAGVQMLKHGQPYDISRARTELGFEPTSLDAAIERAYAWYRAAGDLD